MLKLLLECWIFLQRCSNIFRNYFDGPKKLFLDLYSVKFLYIPEKPFFLWCHCLKIILLAIILTLGHFMLKHRWIYFYRLSQESFSQLYFGRYVLIKLSSYACVGLCLSVISQRRILRRWRRNYVNDTAWVILGGLLKQLNYIWR